MTEKEKGVKKVDPITNRNTENNSRRLYFLNEFLLHLRKLLLHELSTDSGFINIYPLKHLIPDENQINNLTPNAAHSEEERVIIAKLAGIKTRTTG